MSSVFRNRKMGQTQSDMYHYSGIFNRKSFEFIKNDLSLIYDEENGEAAVNEEAEADREDFQSPLIPVVGNKNVSSEADDDDISLVSLEEDPIRAASTNETFLSVILEIFFPFMLAGFGMVFAGLVLDLVQHWPVFEHVPELFILIPSLLGLKGNLEMTLASRLSTHSNLGNLDNWNSDSYNLILGNIALVVCQGILVGLLSSLIAITLVSIGVQETTLQNSFLLCTSGICTASIASFILAIVMVLVVIVSRHFRINPDNVATPIAASLGDLVTLTLLSHISSSIYHMNTGKQEVLSGILVSLHLLSLPILVYLVCRCQSTKQVLVVGWVPIIIAMGISSVGGLILKLEVVRYPGIAVFQPVINGVGGNLVAVQASRISTFLHTFTPNLGILPKTLNILVNPCGIFCASKNSAHWRANRILFLILIPGHLVFVFTISYLKAGHTSSTPFFLIAYMIVAILQLWVLLHTAHWMIHLMWKRGTDPDNSAIPYLTALGDFFGTLFLSLAFEFLYFSGDRDADVAD